MVCASGLLLYYVHDLSPFLVRFNEQLGLRWYGLAYVSAFAAAYFLFCWLAGHGYSDLKREQVGDFITGCAIFGVILGGRLGYMLFYGLEDFLANPLIFFKVWDGGMSAHGGILGVMLYTLWYSRRHKVPWLDIGDNLVVAVPIGLFLGRVANFINGELYGRITSVSWAIQFPKELYDRHVPEETKRLVLLQATEINPDWNTLEAVVDNVRTSPELREQLAGTLSPRHPSQLYEAALEGALLFAVLWILRTKFRLPNGVLTGVFFVGYALLRCLGEFFRQPDAPLTGPLTRGQFLSLFIFLIGIAFLVAAYRRPRFPAALVRADG